MAFGGLLLTTGLSAALVWQSMQSRVVPYVVEVDSLGQAQAVTPATKDYRPTDPQISWFLAKFITDIRGRSLDPVLMRENWLSAYDFATERASLFLGEYAHAKSEEHTSELQSLMRISYAVFCLKKKKIEKPNI